MKFRTTALVLFVLMLVVSVSIDAQNTFTNYPNGFPNGVVIQNIPMLTMHGGNNYWVDSGTGSNGNNGTFQRPFATIEYAIGKCTANNGDIIMVKPGHAETLSDTSSLNLDVAGITIIGVGNGTSRPTITIGGGKTTEIDVDAANITVSNFIFKPGYDSLANMIDVNKADFSLINCEISHIDTTYQNVLNCITTDANADRMLIDGFTYRGYNTIAAGDSVLACLKIVGGDDITIKNFNIDGYFSTAAIQNVTTAAVNLRIYGEVPSFIRNRNSSDVCVTCVATTTGFQGPNIYARLADNADNITEAFVGADMQFMQPIAMVNADGESSLNTDITASVSE